MKDIRPRNLPWLLCSLKGNNDRRLRLDAGRLSYATIRVCVRDRFRSRLNQHRRQACKHIASIHLCLCHLLSGFRQPLCFSLSPCLHLSVAVRLCGRSSASLWLSAFSCFVSICVLLSICLCFLAYSSDRYVCLGLHLSSCFVYSSVVLSLYLSKCLLSCVFLGPSKICLVLSIVLNVLPNLPTNALFNVSPFLWHLNLYLNEML